MSKTKTKKVVTPPSDGKRYEWRTNARGPIPARIAGPELARIAEGDGTGIQHLKPKAVVDESRHPDAVLHPAFEWRDEVAAEKHRENQARSLIRNIVEVEIVSSGPTISRDVGVSIQPAPPQRFSYVHVNSAEVGHCYMATSEVMADAELRKQAIAEALGQLQGLKRRYEHLSELGEVFAAIDRAAQRSA